MSGRYSDHDVEHYDRPRRRTRPRTKERPTYDDAVDGVVEQDRADAGRCGELELVSGGEERFVLAYRLARCFKIYRRQFSPVLKTPGSGNQLCDDESSTCCQYTDKYCFQRTIKRFVAGKFRFHISENKQEQHRHY